MKTRRKKLLEVEKTATTHPGLWLDKYIEEQEKKDVENRSYKDQNKGKNRADFVKEVATLHVPVMYEKFFEVWKMRLDDYGTQTREAQVRGRMIVGLGNESVLETSITLHHTYGVPYIPGSALKGLAASYADKRLGNDWKKGSDAYKVIFGDTNSAGYITFFDALYIPDSGHKHNGKAQALYTDVITVHHQKYYQDEINIPPADWDSPNPVPFLSATGKYLIALAAPDLGKDSKWIKKTFELLRLALKEMGIGAKTSSGYGRMELEQEIDLDSPDIQDALRLKEEIDKMPDAEVSRRMQSSYFSRWAKMPSQEAKRIVARAIIEKVQKAGVEKTIGLQPWYKVILQSVG
ncbi:MAG TPA: type III-B CRISPR module RAMP protein Cmr6 [Ktedonobacteraceae bacterium]|nr:type III-B CRISPR module RAMP protein Cmr6 [Ktedonobacteraceae bacterium]